MHTYSTISDFDDQARLDFASQKLPFDVVTPLLQFFEQVVEKAERVGLIHAEYQTSDFPETLASGIAGFVLSMERVKCRMEGGYMCYWKGRFFRDGGWMEVTSSALLIVSYI